MDTRKTPWKDERQAGGDELLTCRQCGADFWFTAREKKKYQQRGFDPPVRCPECRKNRARLAPEPDWQRSRRRSRDDWGFED